MAPSAAPAPTRVCSSSMKSTTSRDERISSRIFLRRSSNSPRYFVPATSAPMSSVRTRLFIKDSGTLPSVICCARPSAMAVLPTPGSPISAGLFFVRRLRIWMTRSISISRPMTGSSWVRRARSVRSRPNWSSRGVFDGFFGAGSASSTVESLSRRSISARTLSRLAPRSSSTWAAMPSPSMRSPSSRCSVPT